MKKVSSWVILVLLVLLVAVSAIFVYEKKNNTRIEFELKLDRLLDDQVLLTTKDITISNNKETKEEDIFGYVDENNKHVYQKIGQIKTVIKRVYYYKESPDGLTVYVQIAIDSKKEYIVDGYYDSDRSGYRIYAKPIYVNTLELIQYTDYRFVGIARNTK